VRLYWVQYAFQNLSHKNDAGMKKRSGDTGGDGYEIALSVEDFYLGRFGHFGQVHGAATSD
jgi:hypothetical protein